MYKLLACIAPIERVYELNIENLIIKADELDAYADGGQSSDYEATFAEGKSAGIRMTVESILDIKNKLIRIEKAWKHQISNTESKLLFKDIMDILKRI